MRLAWWVWLPVSVMIVLLCEAQAKEQEIEGILIARACLTKIQDQKSWEFARAHTRDCALSPDSVKSGYGVLRLGRRYTFTGPEGSTTSDFMDFFAFDDEGNKMAEQLLRESKRKKDLKVRVWGEIVGDLVKVRRMKLR